MYYARFHYDNPVTGIPVQYPPGIGAIPATPESQPALTLPSPPKNANEFTVRLADLERQIQASIAYDAVENLVSAHGYYLDDSEQAKNSPAIHQTVQPVIHIAPDSKTATIEARLLKIGGKAGELAGGTYAGRAINRAGVWSLQDLTLRLAWSSPFSHWTPVVERRILGSRRQK
jgi:hypothetical protein